MNTQLDSTFAVKSVALKDEFQKQVRRDLIEFAAQTLTYANSRTDERLSELARQFYAARLQDRKRTAEGFQYIQTNIENGLVTLAARTDEMIEPK